MSEKDRLIDRLIEQNQITKEEAELLREKDLVLVREKDYTPAFGSIPAVKEHQGWIQSEIERRAEIAKNCPCNPANGGSGICGCVLTGPIIT